MATSILEKVNIEKTAKNIKKTAGKLNKVSINASEEMVDVAIEAGEEWTKVMAKVMKNGTILFGKQQDIVLDTLEGVKAQYFTGAKRFGKLIEFPFLSKTVKKATTKATKTAKAKVEGVSDSMDDMLDMVTKNEFVKTAKSKVDEVLHSVDEVLDTVKTDVTKMITPKTAKKTTAKKVVKATKKVVKATAKKTTPKVAKKVVAKKAINVKVVTDNLKKVEGIGVKIELILNEGGIKTFEQLATAKVAVVKEILVAAGSRYKMHNPATWGKQAKLAAAGKWTALETLQGQLKGGKVVK